MLKYTNTRSLTPIQPEYTADAGIARGDGITTNYRIISVIYQSHTQFAHKWGRGPLIGIDVAHYNETIGSCIEIFRKNILELHASRELAQAVGNC